MSIQKIKDKQSFYNNISSNEDVLVKFEATWCMPCKAMSPIIEEFAKNNPNVKVVAVDVDDEDVYDLLGELEVKSVPTFIRMKAGKVLRRASGSLTRTALLTLAGE